MSFFQKLISVSVRRFIVYYNRNRITTMNLQCYPPAIYWERFEADLLILTA